MMQEFSQAGTEKTRENQAGTEETNQTTVPGMAFYDSQQDNAGTALGLSSSGSFSTTAAEDFRKADLKSAAISQGTKFFELSP